MEFLTHEFTFEDLTDKELYIYMFLLENCHRDEEGNVRGGTYNLLRELEYKRGKNTSKKCTLKDHTVMTLNEFFDCCRSLHKKKFIKKWYYKIHVHSNGGSMDEFSCVLLNYCPEVIKLAKETFSLRLEIRNGQRELIELREYINNN